METETVHIADHYRFYVSYNGPAEQYAEEPRALTNGRWFVYVCRHEPAT